MSPPASVLEHRTKPLPGRTPSQVTEPWPWLLQLADGAICELGTGTSALVDGQDVPYECSGSRRCSDGTCPYLIGVTSQLSRGNVWRAEKLVFRSTRCGIELLKRTSVAVATVWQ